MVKKIWQIQTRSGMLRSRYEGTKEQALKWARDHYMKNSYKVIEDRKFKWRK